MSLEAVLGKVVAGTPECVASGYVDMVSGMLLAAKTVDSHPQEVLDLVSAATADLFQGPNVTAIEKVFRKARGQKEDNSHYFNEILVMSENLLHVFLRGKKHREHALIVVCRKSANLGMVLTKTRTFQDEVENEI